MATFDVGVPRNLSPSQINLRVLAACTLFASKDENRYYLNGVRIEIEPDATTYVATDGPHLIAYRDERAEGENEFLGRYVLPTGVCKLFKLGKDEDPYALIFADRQGGRLSLAYGLSEHKFAPIESAPLAWRRVVAHRRASGQLAQFDLEGLADFAKFAGKLGLPSPFVAMNGGAPAPVYYPGHPDIIGMVCPIKLTDELSRMPPDWTRPGPEDDGEQMDLETAIDNTPKGSKPKDANVAQMPRKSA